MSAKNAALRKKITFSMSGSRYEVVRDAATAQGWTESEDEDEFFLHWIDTSVSVDRVKRLKPYQRINHYPGMLEICRKVLMAKNLNRMRQQFQDEYKFFPKTFVLPNDYAALRSWMAEKRVKPVVIVKPNAGCQGKGIFLTKNLSDIQPFDDVVVQKYLSKPFLLDGRKFDLRVYAAVLSIEPLEIWLYEDGLCRICTEEYEEPNNKNMDVAFMHLTNYAINKKNEQFVQNNGNDEGATKRSIRWFKEYLNSRGLDAGHMWGDVAELVIKTIISIATHLVRVSEDCGSAVKCFEILGFDVLLDHKLKPWLVEVNHSPSFTCDSELDYKIKFDVISGLMKQLHFRASDKKRFEQMERVKARQRLLQGVIVGTAEPPLPGGSRPGSSSKTIEPAARREKILKSTLYRKIYPTPQNQEKYQKIVDLDSTSRLRSPAAGGGPVIFPHPQPVAEPRGEENHSGAKYRSAEPAERTSRSSSIPRRTTPYHVREARSGLRELAVAHLGESAKPNAGGGHVAATSLLLKPIPSPRAMGTTTSAAAANNGLPPQAPLTRRNLSSDALMRERVYEDIGNVRKGIRTMSVSRPSVISITALKPLSSPRHAAASHPTLPSCRGSPVHKAAGHQRLGDASPVPAKR